MRPYTDEERRLLAERASPGHARAVVLLRLLELAMEQADVLTDEHPPRCKCDFCRGNTEKCSMSGLVNTSRAWARTQSRSSRGVSPSKSAGRTPSGASAFAERNWSAASAFVGAR